MFNFQLIAFAFIFGSVFTLTYDPGCNLDCEFDGRYVCTANGITFPNSCFAECMGITDYVEGICAKPCECLDTYQPVCSITGQTYRNKCEADCNGAIILSANACRCDCPNHNQPVCGNDQVTYLNTCHASCAGVGVLYLQPCKENPNIRKFPDFAEKNTA